MDSDYIQKSIREIETGDYLAEDAVSDQGQKVLARGTALEPVHVSLLMEHRIFTVKVGTRSQVNESELAPHGGTHELDHMFGPHLEDPLMYALYHAALEYQKSVGPATGRA